MDIKRITLLHIHFYLHSFLIIDRDWDKKYEQTGLPPFARISITLEHLDIVSVFQLLLE